MKKFDYIGFFSNILAVILGIVITFAIQSVLDNKHEKENVHSALMLVKQELTNSRNDIISCAEFMDLEGTGANYIISNKDTLKRCDPDTVSMYGQAVISEMFLTMPQDALELLKTSSLFQAIGDNDLSLKIIRAYDRCTAITAIFNKHESQKGEIMNSTIAEQMAENYELEHGNFTLTKMMQDKDCFRTIVSLKNVNGSVLTSNLSDVDDAITAIEEYLNK